MVCYFHKYLLRFVPFLIGYKNSARVEVTGSILTACPLSAFLLEAGRTDSNREHKLLFARLSGSDCEN